MSLLSPLKERGPLFEQPLYHFNLRMKRCSEFGSNWPSGSGEDEKFKRKKDSLSEGRTTDNKHSFLRQGSFIFYGGHFSSCITGCSFFSYKVI